MTAKHRVGKKRGKPSIGRKPTTGRKHQGKISTESKKKSGTKRKGTR